MFPFASLDGLNAVVTGASSGIGRATAWELAQAGAAVVATFRQSSAAGIQLEREGLTAGLKVRSFRADVSDISTLPSLMEALWHQTGGIDVWVNNAGVDLLTTPEAKSPYLDKLQRLFEVDLRGTIALSKLVGEKMKKRGRGVIINVGWDQADRGMEGDSGELFAATKNAIMGFSRSLALSLAPEVRVNCVAPGWILTAWGEQAGAVWQERVKRETPLARWGTPQDIANVVRFLVSPEASYLTGQVINVNGGAVR